MTAQRIRPGMSFRVIQIMAVAMLIIAPLVYLAVALAVTAGVTETRAGYGLLVYILLVVGIVQPAVVPLIQRYQVRNFRKSRDSGMTLENLYGMLVITRLAFVEAIYIYGLVVALVTGDTFNLVYFYIVGAAWAVIYWPRRGNYERFLAQEAGNDGLQILSR